MLLLILSLGWSVGSTWTFTITGRVYCLNDTIVEFVTSSPPNMNKTNITQASNYTFVMGFTWTPNADQIGRFFSCFKECLLISLI